MPKDNLLFKLDNLEYQYHYLNGDLDAFRPRLSSTTKLYNAKGKKSSKKVAKLLSQITLPEVTKELDALRTEIFNNKVYHLEKNLQSYLLKQMTQYRPKKNSKTDFSSLIESLKTKYGLEKFSELVCKSKIIKLSLSKIVPSKSTVPPQWFEKHPFWIIHNDKTHEFNPTRIWLEVLLENEKSDQLISTLMNNERCKILITSFDSGMNVFLGIKEKKNKRVLDTDQKIETTKKFENEERQALRRQDTHESADYEDRDDDSNLDDELLKQYDGMLVGSDEEDENDKGIPALDSGINYNEVTDEEPDQEDSSDESLEDEEEVDIERPQRKKQKFELPELMAGYYSGGESGSESDPAEDKIAREQIALNEKKKNRRGQRARRKIWEKKYGREAKHIQRELEKEQEDRRKRKEEFEVRVAKRAAKAAACDPKDAVKHRNSIIGEKRSNEKEKEVLAEHPSWVAKKNAEEKQKNAKFQGKKIKFD